MADQVRHIQSPEEFTALLSSTMYVVADFYADWCGPCKMIAPAYEQMAKTYGLSGYLAFAKINVDHQTAIAQQYRVSAMPTFLFFKQGKQVAVNGSAMLQGANPPVLSAAAEKLGRLAKEKAAAAGKE